MPDNPVKPKLVHWCLAGMLFDVALFFSLHPLFAKIAPSPLWFLLLFWIVLMAVPWLIHVLTLPLIFQISPRSSTNVCKMIKRGIGYLATSGVLTPLTYIFLLYAIGVPERLLYRNADVDPDEYWLVSPICFIGGGAVAGAVMWIWRPRDRLALDAAAAASSRRVSARLLSDVIGGVVAALVIREILFADFPKLINSIFPNLAAIKYAIAQEAPDNESPPFVFDHPLFLFGLLAVAFFPHLVLTGIDARRAAARAVNVLAVGHKVASAE